MGIGPMTIGGRRRNERGGKMYKAETLSGGVFDAVDGRLRLGLALWQDQFVSNRSSVVCTGERDLGCP